MTTEKTDQSVSADEEQDEDSVSAEEEQIAQAVADAVDAPVADEPAEPQAPSPLTAADLDDRIARLESSLQGRTANWNAEQNRQFQESMRQELDAHLSPLREQASLIEDARVQQLEPEEQAEYWRQKATQKAEPQPVQEQAPVYQQNEIVLLKGKVEGMLSGIGLDIDPEDDRLWAGARVGASVDDLFALARRNAQGLTPKPKAAEPAAPERPRVPSSTGASRRQGRQFNSRTDIAEALTNGDINSDQAREYTRNLT